MIFYCHTLKSYINISKKNKSLNMNMMEMQKFFNKSFNNNKEKLTKKKMSLCCLDENSYEFE